MSSRCSRRLGRLATATLVTLGASVALGGPGSSTSAAKPVSTTSQRVARSRFFGTVNTGQPALTVIPAADYGSMRGQALAAPIVGMASTPDGDGYWLVAADGGIFTYGDARFYGSAGALHLNRPIVGMAATPDGGGYWLVAADGGIFAYGDAEFFGSAGALRLAQPIVGMEATPTGRGYWLVAADGGIFAYGDAGFFGSAGALRLNQPVVGMAASPDGRGYWLTGADGGIFTYGDARFYGSAGALHLNRPVVGMAASPTGQGYWLVAADGGIFTYGDATFDGAAVNQPAASVGMSAGPPGAGYWIVAADGGVVAASPEHPIVPPAATVSTSPATAAPSANLTSSGSVLGTASEHTFLVPGTNGGPPARWNPCATIRYAVNLSAAPPSWQTDLNNAIAQVSKATGISFTAVGTTTAIPSVNQPPSGVDAIIGWVLPSQAPKLDGGDGTVGYGGGYYLISTAGTPELVGGYVAINGQGVGTGSGQVRPGGGVGETEVELLLHELGHMMGLNHVTNPVEVMYPDINPQSQGRYEAGDLAGLSDLGSNGGGCLTPS